MDSSGVDGASGSDVVAAQSGEESSSSEDAPLVEDTPAIVGASSAEEASPIEMETDAAAPDSLDAVDSSAEASDPSKATDDANGSIAYPTGWLAVDAEGVPAGVPVRIRYLPDMAVAAHRNGKTISEQEQAQLNAELPSTEGLAVVEYDGATYQVDPTLLLVNLPDMLPQACYDVVYSYSSTSTCAGMEIPGITGQSLNGYTEGKQESTYWAHEGFAVPCAYATACKVKTVCDELEQQGYRLLVYDAYRPMAAQWQLSDAFQQAYAENPAIAASLGEWSAGWYVSQGSAGHNYGTDLDVGVCDSDGNPLPMPSSFDAFDETGHLTYAPMDAGFITPDSYRDAVASNEACMSLHVAFRNAGFTELASEWWHFGDPQTEYEMRAVAGDGGLDFVATIE